MMNDSENSFRLEDLIERRVLFLYYFAKSADVISGEKKYVNFTNLLAKNGILIDDFRYEEPDFAQFQSLVKTIIQNSDFDNYENKPHHNHHHFDKIMSRSNEEETTEKKECLNLIIKLKEDHPMINILIALCELKTKESIRQKESIYFSIFGSAFKYDRLDLNINKYIQTFLPIDSLDPSIIKKKSSELKDFYSNNSVLATIVDIDFNKIDSYIEKDIESIKDGFDTFFEDFNIYENIKEYTKLINFDKSYTGDITIDEYRSKYSPMAKIQLDIPKMAKAIYLFENKKM